MNFLQLSSSRIMNCLELKVNTNVSFNTDRISRDLMRSRRICPHTCLTQPWLITQVLEWGHQQAMPTCDLYVTWNVLFCICAVFSQGQRDCRGTTFLSLLHHSCQSSSRSSVVFLFVFNVRYPQLDHWNAQSSCTPFILLYPVVLLSQAGDVSPAPREYHLWILPQKY